MKLGQHQAQLVYPECDCQDLDSSQERHSQVWQGLGKME